jgi:hypothetical protein
MTNRERRLHGLVEYGRHTHNGSVREPPKHAAQEAPVATIRYSADGTIAPERFIAALTDFSDRRAALWPNLDTKFYRLHEQGDTWAEVTEGTDILGGIWATERYDWSEPGHVVLRLIESPHFRPGTTIEYTVAPRPGGGCHVEVVSTRSPTSWQGRLVGSILSIVGTRRLARDLRTTLERLEDAAS